MNESAYLHSLTLEERELYAHTIENRLGELCGTLPATPEQWQHARDEGREAVRLDREAREGK